MSAKDKNGVEYDSKGNEIKYYKCIYNGWPFESVKLGKIEVNMDGFYDRHPSYWVQVNKNGISILPPRLYTEAEIREAYKETLETYYDSAECNTLDVTDIHEIIKYLHNLRR